VQEALSTTREWAVNDCVNQESEGRGMTEYTSRVPKFDYPVTLPEQEAALAANPLLARMNAARRDFSDRHRPIYHYVNPEGVLNDPNGLCYWQDRWHLFYQAYPPEDTRQHWGHAISDDLIHWRDLPYCIYPDPEECCFSGSTLVEADRVIAMYHGTKVGNMVATSSDPLLLNWQKVANKAVIPMGPDLPYSVFDPCIWRQGDFYYSLSGGVQYEGPGDKPVAADFLFRSSDLEHWEYLHPFVENDRFTRVGDDGACPYFWPIGDKHILLFFSHINGGQYLIGNYDTSRQKFVVTNGGGFNFGPVGPAGVHAPSATPWGDDVMVIFNVNAGWKSDGWNQIMSLPRQLSLGERDELLMKPAGEIESLRSAREVPVVLALPANTDVAVPSASGDAIEIVATIEVQDAKMVQISVLSAPALEETTVIRFYPNRGHRDRTVVDGKPVWLPNNSLISLDTSLSSVGDVPVRAAETAEVRIDRDEPVRLRIFVDRSIVEVFVNDRQCVATRVYPTRDDSTHVFMRAQGGNARIADLCVYDMASIYD
jgi:beta-fructofuranosidase